MKRVGQTSRKDTRVTLSIELHSGEFITLTVPQHLLFNNLRQSSVVEVLETLQATKDYIQDDHLGEHEGPPETGSIVKPKPNMI